MSGDYPVPFGYLPIFDAFKRAHLEYATDIKARFVGLLLSGRLQAWCADAVGNITRIDPGHWTSEHARLALDENEVRTGPVFRGKRSEGRPVFLEADLDQLLPTFEQRRTAAASQGLVKNLPPLFEQVRLDKGGSKALYDEIGFLIEAFKLIYESPEPPASQADLIRKALDAYQQKGLKGGIPSAEWPKGLVRRLWKELGFERRAAPTKRNR